MTNYIVKAGAIFPNVPVDVETEQFSTLLAPRHDNLFGGIPLTEFSIEGTEDEVIERIDYFIVKVLEAFPRDKRQNAQVKIYHRSPDLYFEMGDHYLAMIAIVATMGPAGLSLYSTEQKNETIELQQIPEEDADKDQIA